MNNKENNNDVSYTPPKFNIPTEIDYGNVMNFSSNDGSELQREVITDSYVTASDNEDALVKRISDEMDILRTKTSGFAGYFSFYYLTLTLFYTAKWYDKCLGILDRILFGVDTLERYLMTGNMKDENGNDFGFKNLTFGESEDETKNNNKFAIDTYNTAKLVHSKASSFESGYALIVASIVLHNYHKQKGMIMKDCSCMRKIVEHIRKFIITENDSSRQTLNNKNEQNS